LLDDSEKPSQCAYAKREPSVKPLQFLREDDAVTCTCDLKTELVFDIRAQLNYIRCGGDFHSSRVDFESLTMGQIVFAIL
jgi:hypothetical protein